MVVGVRLLGVERGQDWLHPDERRRRGLAERLVRELAHDPSGRHGAGNEFVASVAVAVQLSSVAEAFEAQSAMSEIRTLVMMLPASELGQVTGRGGVVMWVHAYDYSAVFPFDPFTGLILVCPDDMGEHCMEVYDDGPQTHAAIVGFYESVVLGIQMRRDEIELGRLPPDPRPLRLPGEPVDVGPSIPGPPG